MSDTSESSDDDTTPRTNLAAVTPQLAPRQNAGRSYNLGTRYGLAGDNIREELWTRQYGGDRSLYQTLGYVIEPKYEHFRARYERLDEARALVDKLPKKAWATPTISDPGAPDGESPFEQQVEEFLATDFGGEAGGTLEPVSDVDALGPSITRGDPIDICQRASRMERLGEYSLIFLGLSDAGTDGADDATATDLEDPVDVSQLDSLEDLAYLAPYDEARIVAEGIEYYQDPTDPRFNTPEYYNVDLGHGDGSARIHHSRVIHVVADVFEDDLRSNSVLEQSLNRLDDIAKVHGASAEAYWRTAYQGLHVSPPQIGGQQADFSDSGEDLHKQIKRYYNNMERAIFSPANIDTLDADAQDPTPHLEAKYRAFAAGHDIPQSILMGNETGERATSEDRRMWHERVAEYRRTFCEARVLRPLINRLVRLGLIAPPQAGRYDITWPPLDEPTEKEQADVASTKAQAVNTATAGNPTMLASVAELRDELFGWKPERGSEVDETAGMQAATSLADPDIEIPSDARQNATVTLYADIPDAYVDAFGREAFVPPKAAQEKAQRILALREEHDDVAGGTDTGWRRAERIASGDPILPDEVIQISAWFARHPKSEAEYDTDHPWQDNGWTARMLWGWDPAKRWADALAERLREFRQDSDRVNDTPALLARVNAAIRLHDSLYDEGDEVDTPAGEGVVVEIWTEPREGPSGENVTASEDSPAYLVGVEDGARAFKASDLDLLENGIQVDGVDDPAADLAADGDDSDRENVDDGRRFDYPPSWRKSETPNRIILLKAWAGLGGRFTSCRRKMSGKVRSPNRLCASMKDAVLQWEGWRQ